MSTTLCNRTLTIKQKTVTLLAYWKFEEGTGVYPKVDASGNGHDLVAGSAGPITQVAGRVNFALQFGSTGTGASLVNTTGSTLLAFDKAVGFTFCAWVYFTGSSFIMTAAFPQFFPTGSPTNYFSMGLYTFTNGGVRLSIRRQLGAGAPQTQNTDVAFPSVNTWHFIRGWWTPADGLGRICIDEGTPVVAATPIALDWPGDVVPMQINISKGTAQPTCRYDEIGYWKGVLNGSQVAYLYNSGNGRTYPDVPPLAG
jgi:hypothetical protein